MTSSDQAKSSPRFAIALEYDGMRWYTQKFDIDAKETKKMRFIFMNPTYNQMQLGQI